jgi:hypothetical protein
MKTPRVLDVPEAGAGLQPRSLLSSLFALLVGSLAVYACDDDKGDDGGAGTGGADDGGDDGGGAACADACANLGDDCGSADQCESLCASAGSSCASCLSASTMCGEDCGAACTPSADDGADDGTAGADDAADDAADGADDAADDAADDGGEQPKTCATLDDCTTLLQETCGFCGLNDESGFCVRASSCDVSGDCAADEVCGYTVQTAEYTCMPAALCPG